MIANSDYNLIIASSGGEVAKERKLIDSLLEMRVDGVVISCIDRNPAKLHTCETMNVPLVVIDRKVEAIHTNQILWDNFTGAYQLTKHLIENGHQRIGIVNVSLNNNNGQERLAGFKQAIKDAEIRCPKEYISKSNFLQEEAYEFVLKVMKLQSPPTALFCANNIMLEGTLEALKELKLDVYNDVSVAIFGNPECNKYLDRKITAAMQDTRSMGRIAGEVMCDLLRNKNNHQTQIVLKTEIVHGESVKKI